MKRNGRTWIYALILNVGWATPALVGAPENSGAKAAAASVVLEDDNYRVANFVGGCYSIGNTAIGGEEGVLKTSMLIRESSLREWIAVYYGPAKISEEKLLKLVRERRCPQSTVERTEGSPLTVMNPQVGPGDVVQLRLAAEAKQTVQKVELPDGWSLVGEQEGFMDGDGVTYFTIRVAPKEKVGMHKVGS
jgi:hypothetical protein